MNRRFCAYVLVALIATAGAGWAGFAAGTPDAPPQFEKKPVFRATITDAKAGYYGGPTPEVDFLGTGFGSVQGTRSIQIDGKDLSAYPNWGLAHWSDTRITIGMPGLVPWEHLYKIAITEKGTVISNVFLKRFLYVIDSVKPDAGKAGDKVKIYVWALPANQGGLVLKLGSHNFNILSWSSSGIEAQVPSVPSKTYDVYLQKGNDVVSMKKNFKVLMLITKPPIVKKQPE